jgi:transcriptional regulator with XRE-family HTH domain
VQDFLHLPVIFGDAMDAASTIGDRLRQERMRLGFNIRDFAARGGVSRTTQSNYENNVYPPDSGYLNRIATTGAEIFWIVQGTPDDDALRDKQRLPYTPVIREMIEDYELSPSGTQDAVRAILKDAADKRRAEIAKFKSAKVLT